MPGERRGPGDRQGPDKHAAAKQRPKATPATYKQRARRRWPHAEWIVGSGPWASVSLCRGGVTVELHAELVDALAACRRIDKIACGGACSRRHEVVSLLDRREVVA